MGNVESLRGQIAERIKTARKAKHLTQPALSEILAEKGVFIAPSAIAKIENNKRGLEVAEAAVLAKILGIKLEQLVRSEDDDDGYAGIMLQDQAFTTALYTTQFLDKVIDSISDHLEIVALKVKLSSNDDFKVSLSDMQKAYDKAEEVVNLINQASFSWKHVLVSGGTLKETILYDEEASGWGGQWQLPPLEELLGIDNGKG